MDNYPRIHYEEYYYLDIQTHTPTPSSTPSSTPTSPSLSPTPSPSPSPTQNNINS